MLQKEVGNEYDVLFETQSEEFVIGHTPSFIEVAVNSSHKIEGSIQRVRIADVKDGICLGVIISEEKGEKSNV